MRRRHRVNFTPLALEMLAAVSDRREREILFERAAKLADEPEKQGKALVGEFGGYRSVRAVGQRYRIVYRILADEVLVLVVGVGRRREGSKKDIYALLERVIGEGEG